MTVLLYAALTALGAVLLLGPLAIPALRRLKFGQSIREEGPKRHYAKSGTPTMGGLLILAAITLSCAFFARGYEVYLALFVTLGHGVIGFLDDFIKVVMKLSLIHI